MSRFETGGNEHFYFFAKKLLARIAEKLFRLRVYQYDLALFIDNHNCVGGRLQQITEFLFRFFSFAGIADGAHAENALVGLDRAQADLHRKLDAVLA